MRPRTAALPAPLPFPARAGARAFLPAPNRSMFGRRVYVIETGARSVVGLMRPRTAALPAPLRFPARAGARRFFAALGRCMFGGRICGIETGRMTGHRADGEYGIWGQTRCLVGHAGLVPGTLVAHKDKAAASCRTPSASRLPTPTASAAARVKPSGSAGRSNGAIWGQSRSWVGAP